MSEVHENTAVNDFAQQESEAAAPQPSAPNQADVMQFLQAKNQMIQMLNDNYKAFMASLRSFPVMQGALQLAMQNFETGLIWMEKGISLVPFDAVQPVPVAASQPQAPEVAAEAQPAVDQSNTEASTQEPLDAA